MYILTGIKTKEFWNITNAKYFAPLIKLYPLIKSLISSFIDIASSTYSVLFEVILLFSFVGLSSKYIFFMKLGTQFLLAKFACVNLAGKFSDVTH